MELGILMDSSFSFSERKFQAVKKFCKHLVSSFKVGPQKTRIALTLYGPKVYSESFGLDEFTTNKEVVDAIGKLKKRGSWDSKTYVGLYHLRDTQMNADIVRPNVPKIAVVLTYGKAERRMIWTKTEGLRTAAANITVISVGAGYRNSYTGLLDIAAGNQANVVTGLDFANLEKSVARIEEKICQAVQQATDVPTTISLGSGVPTTISPGSGAPTTTIPGSGVPTTISPGSGVPTTMSPESDVPTTTIPGSGVPTTMSPGSGVPTTMSPGSGVPTNISPGSDEPTTISPGSGVPTTNSPGSDVPTTISPESGVPTTISPGSIDNLRCRNTPRELALLMDSSNSISRTKFQAMKKICQRLVSSFEIGPEKTRVAVTLFGQKVYKE
ncbi:collagen alpha-1(XX) chain, partial [Elysia marginata]